MSRTQPPRCHSIQEASAGTGKTFALSSRYLQLLVDGAAPESILATTFTRKGAGEILDRIMHRLGQAALSPTSAEILSAEIDRPLTPPQVVSLLRRLADALPLLQVGTLDGFFYRIVRGFSFELGLPPDWELVDPLRAQVLKDQATEQILTDQTTVQLLKLISKAEADRRVADLIQGTVEQLFEVFRDSTPEAWSLLGDIVPTPQREIDTLLAELRQLSREGLNAKLQEQLEQIDRELEVRSWDALATKLIVRNALQGIFRYQNKPFPEPLAEVMRKLAVVVQKGVQHLVQIRTAATRDLLQKFDARLQPLQLDAGELTFGDLTFHLARTTHANPRSLAARLGRPVEHLLLDEFQDTSSQQWAILRPLAEHVTAPGSGRTFFCVGDRKQAIYGWRGGVERLFEAVYRDLGDRVQTAPPLTTSWRSCPVIIEFVNQIFGSIANLPVASDSPESVAFADWGQKFSTHRSAYPEQKGFVSVRRAQWAGAEEDRPDSTGVIMTSVVDEIAEWVCRFPGKSIGVLLRANQSIADLAGRLQQAGIAVSEEAGNPLTDSAAVEVVLSAVTLADHPTDGLARFHLAHSPLGATWGLQPETQANQQENAAIAHRLAARLRADLLRQGYGKTLRQWAAILGPECTDREATRLEQLVDAAYSFDAQWTLRPQRFVDLVRFQRMSDRSGAKVRLMTMHAAKGLDFDLVIVPLLSTRAGWSTQTPPVVTHRSDPAAPIDRVCRYVNREMQGFLPDALKSVFAEHAAQQVTEELCLLYVALTRAKRQLSVIVPPESKAETRNPVGIVLQTLQPNSPPEEILVFEAGTRDWNSPPSPDDTATRRPSKEASSTLGAAVRLAAGRRTRRGLPWKRASRSDSSWWGKHQGSFRPDRRALATRRGSLWHAFLGEWKWIDPDRPPSVSMNSEARPAGLKQMPDPQRAEILRALRQPALAKIFQQAAYHDWFCARRIHADRSLLEPLNFEVLNERGFVVSRDSELIEGSIDRLVLGSEGDRRIAADIFEFKTGQTGAPHSEIELASYRSQVEEYRRVVQQLWGLDGEQVSGFLVFVETGTILEV